jgi:hypothetical protein
MVTSIEALDDHLLATFAHLLADCRLARSLASLSAVSHRFRHMVAPILNAATKHVDADGDELWGDILGTVHRDGGLPAAILAAGTRTWCQHNKLHRDGGLPAAIYPDGARWWFQHDKLHRDGGLPAVVYPDGTLEYWTNGVRTDPL